MTQIYIHSTSFILKIQSKIFEILADLIMCHHLFGNKLLKFFCIVKSIITDFVVEEFPHLKYAIKKAIR
jgi:hypothetical protein